MTDQNVEGQISVKWTVNSEQNPKNVELFYPSIIACSVTKLSVQSQGPT